MLENGKRGVFEIEDYNTNIGVVPMHNLIFEKVKELYVMRRKTFVIQTNGGSYVTSKGYLGDNILKKHLNGETTIGVFAGQVYTNFISFDLDYRGIGQAERVARQLVQALKDSFYLSDSNILVTFSGGKGYHVDVFFTNPIQLKDAKRAYLVMLEELNENSSNIEFRPTTTQAVKLPLSFHKKHNTKCYIVDNATFKQVGDENILAVTSVDEVKFLDTLDSRLEQTTDTSTSRLKLDKDQVLGFENVLDGLSTKLDVDRVERCMGMLSNLKLTYSGSRHNSTLLLLMYLNDEGYSKEDAIDIVKNVITNTYSNHRDLISTSTTLEYSLKEVERLYKYAERYTLDYTKDKELYLYEDDILTVLSVGQLNLKRVLFVLMLHSKRYAKSNGVFYMTYKQMADMGLTKNGHRLKEHIIELEHMGLVERISYNVNKDNSYYKEPNQYKVNFEQYVSSDRRISLSDIELDVNSFEGVVVKLVNKESVKDLVGRYQYNTYFRHLYEAV